MRLTVFAETVQNQEHVYENGVGVPPRRQIEEDHPKSALVRICPIRRLRVLLATLPRLHRWQLDRRPRPSLWGRGTGGGDARHQRLRLEGCRLLAKADKEGGEESPGEEGARHPFGGFDDIYLLPTVRECESAAGGAGMAEWNLGRLGGGGVVRRRGDDATMRRCDCRQSSARNTQQLRMTPRARAESRTENRVWILRS